MLFNSRMEVYHPPYLYQGNVPRITTLPPTFTPYGSSFEVGFAFDSTSEVTAVVLHNAGGVTHNYAIGEFVTSVTETSSVAAAAAAMTSGTRVHGTIMLIQWLVSYS
jgi:hypothetical protein